jgi:hypothetical protein
VRHELAGKARLQLRGCMYARGSTCQLSVFQHGLAKQPSADESNMEGQSKHTCDPACVQQQEKQARHTDLSTIAYAVSSYSPAAALVCNFFTFSYTSPIIWLQWWPLPGPAGLPQQLGSTQHRPGSTRSKLHQHQQQQATQCSSVSCWYCSSSVGCVCCCAWPAGQQQAA